MQPGSAIYFLMDEADVQRILAFDETMIGSDGMPLGEKPHPRLWGTFPRVLGHYSRDVGLFPLETAVWKMTGPDGAQLRPGRPRHAGSRPAGRHGGVRRRPRCATPRPTTSRRAPAEGIHAVIVNGAVAWEDGRSTGIAGGEC